MPLIEQHLSVVARSVRAFLDLRAGVIRSGAAPPPPSWLPQASGQDGQLEEARQLLASKGRELAALRARLADNGAPPGLVHYLAKGRETWGLVRAEQLIWMFCHSRTESTWLSWMMAEFDN